MFKKKVAVVVFPRGGRPFSFFFFFFFARDGEDNYLASVRRVVRDDDD